MLDHFPFTDTAMCGVNQLAHIQGDVVLDQALGFLSSSQGLNIMWHQHFAEGVYWVITYDNSSVPPFSRVHLEVCFQNYVF